MLTVEQALKIVARYTPDLTVEQRTDLLTEKAVTRTVAGQPVTLFDPYASALADLYDPERVKARTQGSVSETYIDPESVAAYLRGESDALRAAWPADDIDSAPRTLDTRLTLKGWR